MDVFEALPNAVLSGVWEIGQVKRATVAGKVFSNPTLCDVIIDEGTYDVTDRSPKAEYQQSDTLLYAKPDQMPSLDTAVLANGYMWKNTANNQFYEIREANLGKNQETGAIEHIEFLLRPTKVAIDNEQSKL